MATIKEEGGYWHLILEPNAKSIENINEPLKGYRASIGQDETGRHVVRDVYYSKDKFNLDDVRSKVESLRNCPRCETLDKESLKLQEIELETLPTPNLVTTSTPQTTQELTQSLQPQPQPQLQTTTTTQPMSDFKNIFANVFFDAYLTGPGKYFLAMMTNDDKLLQSVLPKTDAEIPDFMDEMVQFLSGEMDFVRTPEEVREYIDAMRSDKDKETKSKQKTGFTSKLMKGRKIGMNQGIVIY